MRLELAQPGLQLVDAETYNQTFTMHGTIMMFLFGTPMVAAFANYLVPLQVGTADMVFPRLNALSYWLFLFGGIVVLSGYFAAGGAADVGWTGYVPNSDLHYSTTTGTDLWIVGLALTGVATILGAINFTTTIYTRRAPGMSMLRMPMFCWNILVASILILFAFPALTGALAMLLFDRRFGATFFVPAAGGDPILWQHLFWFFGHPEVYILALPFFGIISEVIPVFSRKPLFGYKVMVLATILIGAYSMSVWAHHMFTTGAINVAFFSLSSFIIAVPTGIKIFNWVATMFRGRLTFPTPMLFATGFIYLFVIGGITGVIVASAPIDYQFQDTYYVVAHLHNVLVGGSVFGIFAGIYFWFPKMTGRPARRAAGQDPLLELGRRLHPDVPAAVPAGGVGHARALPGLRGEPGLDRAEPDLDGRVADPGPGRDPVPRCGRARRCAAAAGPAERPVGGELARVVDDVATAATTDFTSLPPIRSERPVFDAREKARASAAADGEARS
jgi:cytochrome c oxidase subunit 1